MFRINSSLICKATQTFHLLINQLFSSVFIVHLIMCKMSMVKTWLTMLGFIIGINSTNGVESYQVDDQKCARRCGILHTPHADLRLVDIESAIKEDCRHNKYIDRCLIDCLKETEYNFWMVTCNIPKHCYGANEYLSFPIPANISYDCGCRLFMAHADCFSVVIKHMNSDIRHVNYDKLVLFTTQFPFVNNTDCEVYFGRLADTYLGLVDADELEQFYVPLIATHSVSHAWLAKIITVILVYYFG